MDEKRNWIGALLSQRQVIPRWHSPQSALHAGERDSIRSNLRPRILPRRWLPLLSEQVQRGDIHADVEIAELQFLLSESPLDVTAPVPPRISALWHRAAEQLNARPPPRPTSLDGDWIAIERANVAQLRAALVRYPQQPLMWSELARAYIVLGHDDKARRAMACAVQLAGRNAYVRRSAARMHLHLNDVAGALRAVRQHPNFLGDPRMLSAEIAIAARAGQPLHHAKRGLQMLKDTNFRPTYLSELAAALATVEMQAGKHKRSRALFAHSLQSPSENALAQVQWASEWDSTIVVPTDAWDVPRSFEAHALAARLGGDWDAVLDDCELWLQDEPFATRPAILGSFATYTDKQSIRAERLATQALAANRNSVPLHNNRAVARAYMGDITGALQDIKYSLGCDGKNVPYLLATIGLIGYRSGDQELGEHGYHAALAQFVKDKDMPSATLASLFWLRELARLGDPNVATELTYIKRNLQRLTGTSPEPEITSMITSLEAQLAQCTLALAPPESRVAEEARDLFQRFEPLRDAENWRGRFIEKI